MLMFLLAKSGVGRVLITTLIDSFSTISTIWFVKIDLYAMNIQKSVTFS